MAKEKLILAPLNAARRQQLQLLSKNLGVRFENIQFLHVALTHKSYAKRIEEEDEAANRPIRKIAHNERLEFLGDAVLELASSIYLFTKFENLSEGELTKTRSAIVCGPTLTKLAKALGLGEALFLSHGENALGGRQRDSNLENAFEAVIGAIYLDQGWEVAKDYVWRQLADEFKNVKLGKLIVDFKSVLQEYTQRKNGNKPEYVIISEHGPAHDKSFECEVRIDGESYGRGIGKSKQLAEKMAAEEALKTLKIID